jgi:hypothetical protein
LADDAFVAPLVQRARGACSPERFAAEQAAGHALAYEEAVLEARAWLAKVTC